MLPPRTFSDFKPSPPASFSRALTSLTTLQPLAKIDFQNGTNPPWSGHEKQPNPCKHCFVSDVSDVSAKYQRRGERNPTTPDSPARPPPLSAGLAIFACPP